MLPQSLAHKVIAVLAAIVLWFYVMITSENPVAEVVFDGVQVEARGAAPGLSVELLPGEVAVAVTGPRKAVSRLSGTDIRAWVTLANRGVGRYRVRPRARVKGGFSTQVKPNTVVAVLRETSKKTLPVEVELMGLPDGYVPGPVTSKPDQVAVEGKEEAVTRVVRVIAKVDMRHSPRFSGEVEPVALGAKGRPVSEVALRPGKVWAEATLMRPLPARVVPIVVRTSGALALGFRIRSASATPAVATITGEHVDQIACVQTAPLHLEGRKTSLTTTLPLVKPPRAESVVPDRVEVSLVVERR